MKNSKHPLAIRICHWLNFLILAMMLWSGILIYWANDVYSIGWGNFTLFPFFPESFYNALNIDHHLARGMSYHFSFMWLFMLNGLVYAATLIITKEYRNLFPGRRALKEAWRVLLHDLHIRRGLPPQKKYNAAQRIAYTLVLFMGILILLTGLAIYKPVQLGWLCTILGGYAVARAIHFTVSILFSLFFLVHVIQVILAGWKNFQGMVTGTEIAKFKRTAISFGIFLFLMAAGITSISMISSRPTEQRAYRPLRKVLNTNEKIFSKIFSNDHLAKTYLAGNAAGRVRVNGNIGLHSAVDTAKWALRVIRNPGDTLTVSLDEIKSMPRTDLVFNFKCIEGWSQVSRWGGVTFADFMDASGLDDQKMMAFAGMSTPDNRYYVGIDMASMLHPQTLLCYEMNGEALPLNQGFPLRLIIPVKYGVKNIKRIGTLYFSNERPPDYWYERGYDYYCGL